MLSIKIVSSMYPFILRNNIISANLICYETISKYITFFLPKEKSKHLSRKNAFFIILFKCQNNIDVSNINQIGYIEL